MGALTNEEFSFYRRSSFGPSRRSGTRVEVRACLSTGIADQLVEINVFSPPSPPASSLAGLHNPASSFEQQCGPLGPFLASIKMPVRRSVDGVEHDKLRFALLSPD